MMVANGEEAAADARYETVRREELDSGAGHVSVSVVVVAALAIAASCLL
jgi:hypothetical protein